MILKLLRHATIIATLLIANGTTGAKAGLLDVRHIKTATNLFNPSYPATSQAGPIPTTPPVPRGQLFKRLDYTCGYLGGISTAPIYCRDGNWCHINTYYSVIGCCGQSSCTLPSVCLPYRSSSDGASITAGQGTIYCNDQATPDCATLSYVDRTYSGYTWVFCHTASTTVPIYNSPTLNPKITSDSTTTFTGPITTPAANPTTTTIITTTSPSPTQPPTPSTPVGAIVGGVVGGVAALALISLFAFLLLRQQKKGSSSPSLQPPFVSQHQPLNMGQTSQTFNAGNNDNTSFGMNKSPVNMTVTSASSEHQWQPKLYGSNMAMSSTLGGPPGYHTSQPVEHQQSYEMPVVKQERPVQEMPGSPEA